MSERDRMRAGELYDSRDPELLVLAHRARALLARFNATASTDQTGRRALLEELLGGAGKEIWIEPPFFCDYGAHVFIGDHTFVHVNCVLLDSAEIRLGSHCLLGPGVQLLTAHHPVRAAERVVEGRGGEEAPYRTRAAPVRIGERVWLGAGVIVLPGVTIGDNVTVGAGSVVTADLPSDVLAFGQPCRVERAL